MIRKLRVTMIAVCLDTVIVSDKENQVVALVEAVIPLLRPRAARPGKKVEKSVARLIVTA